MSAVNINVTPLGRTTRPASHGSAQDRCGAYQVGPLLAAPARQNVAQVPLPFVNDIWRKPCKETLACLSIEENCRHVCEKKVLCSEKTPFYSD